MTVLLPTEFNTLFGYFLISIYEMSGALTARLSC